VRPHPGPPRGAGRVVIAGRLQQTWVLCRPTPSVEGQPAAEGQAEELEGQGK
jgi:hypothetical protein